MLQINGNDVQRATRNLLDQGIIGSLLFLAVVIIIALIVLGRKNYNRQLLDKDRHIMKLEGEIDSMKRSYRESIEGAIATCQHAINKSDRAIDENTRVLGEIRLLLVRLLERTL